MSEPRMPERTRILRPSLWIDEATGSLAAEVFRLYLGLTTCADDAGWLPWKAGTLAAHLYRYESAKRRERLLGDGAVKLVDAGLLVLHACGCAELPYFARDFRQAGGNHSEAVLGG